MIKFLGDTEKKSLTRGLFNLINLKKLDFLKSNGSLDKYFSESLPFNEMCNIFELLNKVNVNILKFDFKSYILNFKEQFLNLDMDLDMASRMFFHLINFGDDFELYSNTVFKYFEKYCVFDSNSLKKLINDISILSEDFDEFFESIVEDENYDTEEYWEVAEEFDDIAPSFDTISSFFENILINNTLIKKNYMIFTNIDLSNKSTYENHPNIKDRYKNLFENFKVKSDGTIDEDDIWSDNEQVILNVCLDDTCCNSSVEDYINYNAANDYEFYYNNEFFCEKHAYWTFAETCIMRGTKKHVLILIVLVLLGLL